MRFLARLLLNGLAIIAASYIVPGIHVSGFFAALVAAAILGIVNAIVKPVLFVLTLPLTLVTLGMFLFVLNALCLGLTAALVPGFSIDGFLPAVLGALFVSVVSWILNGLLVGPSERVRG